MPDDPVTAALTATEAQPGPDIGHADAVDRAMSDDPMVLADAGIELRDAGAYAPAAAIFQDLIERCPHLVYGWQEMAVLKALLGDVETALELFTRASQVDPADWLTRRHLIKHQVRLGLHDAAMATVRAHTRAPERVRTEIALLEQFIEFVRAYPEQWAHDQFDRFRQSGCYLKPDMVEQRILAAVEARAPFSLIRLGDGEGAWLSVSAADEARFARLYEAGRRKFEKIWFGTETVFRLPSFLATRQRLTAAVERADIVGVPYPQRIAHEYRAFSATGVAGCVNILRLLEPPGGGERPGAYCSQDIHHELHFRRFFPTLFALPMEFGIVSCHPDLGYRLAAAFGARVAKVFIVPEELGFADVIDGLSAIDGISGATEPHFPFAYNRMIAKLQDQAARAQVWIIAAGYLGKIYCDVVRQAGAIALDVGSIVDGWCGTVTRPYLQRIENFRL